MKTQIELLVSAALKELVAEGVFPGERVPRPVIERTRDTRHGDFACNIAMVLAKAARCKPRDLAVKLVAALPASPLVKRIEVAGPGFINFHLTPTAYHQLIAQVLHQGPDFGRSKLGAGKRVQVEFVSANPTGPLHVGHGRGAAYGSVMFQNANLSVRVTDEFMETAEKGGAWNTRWVTDQAGGEPPSYDANELLNRMASCAWHCGDPGVQYDTTINRWHTCPNSGRINASNPCSEYMFLDDTACNLASINLMKFRRSDGGFDAERFRAACRVFFIAQEILVDHASYPTKPIAENSHRFRPIGLGYSNLGSLLMSSGIAYDSETAYGVCGSITALMHGSANLASAARSAPDLAT